MDATVDLTAGAGPVPLTALVPCFNEGPQVDVAYRAIDEALSARYPDLEILFVDDGSTDDTLDHIKRLADRDPRVRYLSFGRNFGLEAAFSAGFRYASRPWIAQLDADLQSPPAEVPRLHAAAVPGYDVVYGIRRDRDDPALRRLGSTIQQWLARRLFGVDLVPGASAFRVVRADVARRAVALRLATPYFIATLPLLGARATTVDVGHARRTAGRSRWRPWRLVAHSFELFFGFSVRPLVWLYAAVVPTTAVLLVAAAIGRTTGAAAPLLLAGQALLLTAVAVVAAYLHRLVRGSARPALFYIREANIPVAPEDSLYGEPPAVRREEVAWPRPS